MVLSTLLAPKGACDSCPLKTRHLCRALMAHPDHARREPAARLRAIKADATIHEENERPRFAGILRKGYLRTERMLRDGRRSVMGFLAPGDMFGDAIGSIYGPALISATDAEYCAFDPTALRRVLQEDVRLNAQFLGEATKQYTRQLEMVWRRGALNSRERIVAFMVMAAEFMPTEPLPDGSIIVTIDLSRKDWADSSNTTVETICRTLTYLTEKDMIETVSPGRYLIRNLGVLARFAGLGSLGNRSAMLQREPLDLFAEPRSPMSDSAGPHSSRSVPATNPDSDHRFPRAAPALG